MKTTMEYMIGNTAVQLVNTGKKVKIIDVEKRKAKRSLVKYMILALAIVGLFVTSCFYLVRLESQRVLLDESVYSLQRQIDQIEKENKVLEKEQQKIAVDYDDIYKKALSLGMKFPTKNQVGTYVPEKSTSIRINASVSQY